MQNLKQLFKKISTKNKKRKALIGFNDGDSLSYEDLDNISNKICNFLWSLKIEKEDVIIIFHDKSSFAYCLMIACIKMGVIYTCLDRRSPYNRLKKIINTCNPKLIFSYDDFTQDGVKIVNYQKDNFKNVTLNGYESNLNHDIDVNLDDPVYIMFTSGSTGFPKGVLISNQNLINFVNWTKYGIGINKKDRLTALNPPYFDNSVFDFFGSIFNGASLICIKPDLLINPKMLIMVLNTKKPTIWFSVPSLLVYLLNLKAFLKNDLKSLEKFIFGGEGFPKNNLKKLWDLYGNDKTFINVYGPTECTCICSSYIVKSKDLESHELLPLGKMNKGFKALILNQKGLIAKDNEVGELLIGGPNVGIGYFNNIDKTNEAFINNPFQKLFNEKYYKSGDLVYFNNKENLLYFVGRKDNQIKRMGYRIELEEIENAFSSIKEIRECAVISKNTEDKVEIIACLASVSIVNKSNLTNELKKNIPNYMIPDRFEEFKSLPKNANGKIDRLTLKNMFVE